MSLEKTDLSAVGAANDFVSEKMSYCALFHTVVMFETLGPVPQGRALGNGLAKPQTAVLALAEQKGVLNRLTRGPIWSRMSVEKERRKPGAPKSAKNSNHCF